MMASTDPVPSCHLPPVVLPPPGPYPILPQRGRRRLRCPGLAAHGFLSGSALEPILNQDAHFVRANR